MGRLIFKSGIHVQWVGGEENKPEHEEYGAGTGLPIPPRVWTAIQQNSENWSVNYVADSTVEGSKAWQQQKEQAQQYSKTPVYFFTDKHGKPGYSLDVNVAKHYGSVTRGSMADVWNGTYHSYDDDGEVVDNKFDHNDISEHLEGGVIRANKDASHRSLLANVNKQQLRYQELYAKARTMKFDMKTRGGSVEFVESPEGKYSLLPMLHFAQVTNNMELMESLAAGIESKSKGKKMTRAIAPRDMFGQNAQHREQGMDMTAEQYFARDTGIISKILNVRNLRQVEDTVKELYKGYYDADLSKKETAQARAEKPAPVEKPRLEVTRNGDTLNYNTNTPTGRIFNAITRGIDAGLTVGRAAIEGRISKASSIFSTPIRKLIEGEFARHGGLTSKIFSGEPALGAIEGESRNVGVMGAALAFLDNDEGFKNRNTITADRPNIVLHGILSNVLTGVDINSEELSKEIHSAILAGNSTAALPDRILDTHVKSDFKNKTEVIAEINRRLTAYKKSPGMKVDVSQGAGVSIPPLHHAGLAMYASVVSSERRRVENGQRSRSSNSGDDGLPDFDTHANYAARTALESFMEPLMADALCGSVVYMGDSQAVDVGVLLSMARLLPIEKEDGHYIIAGNKVPVDGGTDSDNPMSTEDRRRVVRDLMDSITSGNTSMGEAYVNVLKNLQHSQYADAGGANSYPVSRDLNITHYDDSSDVDHGYMTSVAESLSNIATTFSQSFMEGATQSSKIDSETGKKMAENIRQNRDNFMSKLPDLLHNSIAQHPELMTITNNLMNDVFDHVESQLEKGSIDQVGNYLEKLMLVPALANTIRSYEKKGMKVQIMNTNSSHVDENSFNTIRNKINAAKEQMNGGKDSDEVSSSLFTDMQSSMTGLSQLKAKDGSHSSHSFMLLVHDNGKLHSADVIGTSRFNQGFGDIQHTAFAIKQGEGGKFRSRARVTAYEGKLSVTKQVIAGMNYTSGHTSHVLHVAKDCDDLEHGNVHNMMVGWKSNADKSGNAPETRVGKIKVKFNMSPSSKEVSKLSSSVTGMFGIKGVV